MQTKNLRTLSVTTGSGTDVKSTSMLKGEAKESSVMKETNSLKEFEPGSCPKGAGANGGKNNSL